MFKRIKKIGIISFALIAISVPFSAAHAVPKMSFGDEKLAHHEQGQRVCFGIFGCGNWFYPGQNFGSGLYADDAVISLGHTGSYVIQSLVTPAKTSGNDMADLWVVPGLGRNIEAFETYVATSLDLTQPNLSLDPNWVSLGVRSVDVFFDLDSIASIAPDEGYPFVMVVSREACTGTCTFSQNHPIAGAEIDAIATLNLDDTMFADVMHSSSSGSISNAPLEKPDGSYFAVPDGGWFIAEFDDNSLKASGDNEADLTIMESADTMENFSVSINAVSPDFGDANWISLGNAMGTGLGYGRFNIEQAMLDAGLALDTEFLYVMIEDAEPSTALTPDIDAIIASAGSASPDNALSCGLPSAPVDPNVTPEVCIDINLEAQNLYAAEVNCVVSNANALVLDNGTYDAVFDPVDRLEVLQVIDSAAGIWEGAVGQSRPGGPVTGIGRFAEVCYSVGIANETVFIDCAARGSDEFGGDIPMTVDCGSIDVSVPFIDPISGTTVSGVALLPVGIDHSGIEVSLHLAGYDYPLDTTTNIAGEYSFGLIADGAYSLSYIADNHVHGCQALEIIGGVYTPIDLVRMISGDINNDSVIDILDFLELGLLYGLTDADLSFDPNSDLKQDGVIDLYDLAILGSHMGYNSCAQ